MIRHAAIALGAALLLTAASAPRPRAQAAPAPGAAAKGEGARAAIPATGPGLYAYHCAECHGAGPGHPGTSALQLKYQGTPPALLTERTDLDADVVRFFVRNGVNAMPYFRKTEISDADLDKIAAYLARSGKR